MPRAELTDEQILIESKKLFLEQAEWQTDGRLTRLWDDRVLAV